MSYSENDPWVHCSDCKLRRATCICKPKCEYSLTDDITKKLMAGIQKEIERLCREVRSMGWGYKLAVQSIREKPVPWNATPCGLPDAVLCFNPRSRCSHRRRPLEDIRTLEG